MSLDGLGNVNTNNASATVTNEQSILDKTQEDSRMITLNNGKFTRCEDVANYFSNWLQIQLGLQNNLNGNIVTLTIGQQTWNVYCVRGLDDVQQIIQNKQNTQMTAVSVMFGYYTASTNSDVDKQLKINGFEKFSLDDIYTLNNAVDAGSKKLPYMSVSSTRLCEIITKMANDKAKQTGVFNAGTVFGDIGQAGKSFGSSLTEGFNQLKDSVGTLIAGLKSTQAHHIAPQQQSQVVQQAVVENISSVDGVMNTEQHANNTKGVSLVKHTDNVVESANLVNENQTCEEHKSSPVSLKK